MRVGSQEFETRTEAYRGGWRCVAFLPGGKQRASDTYESREGAEYSLYQKLEAEFPDRPALESKAEQVVNAMLEADHDQHVKAYQRIQTWDKANSTYRDLYALKVKAMEKYKEIGSAIAYERALASIGVSREEVAHVIRADQIGATHNYRRTVPSKQCRNMYCDMKIKHFPASAENCPECQEPLTPSKKSLAPSDLRGKYAAYWVGVETHDGRTIMFDSPVPPNPWQDELNASVAQE